MARVLLTGFEPFAGALRNPAQDIVLALDGWSPPGHQVIGVSLPCVFGQARRIMEEAIISHAPDVVLALGMAANRSAVSVERVAVNFMDARTPDNAGRQPVDCAVVDDGPAAYFSTLPLRHILARLRANGIPAEMSMSAGTYVCNEVFYGLMHMVSEALPGVRAAGFIHVPALPGQFGPSQPGMPLDLQCQAIRVAVLASVDEADAAVPPLGSEGSIN